MDDEGETEYANAEAQHQQIISDAANEFERALVSQQPVNTTPMLDRFLDDHRIERLERVRDLLQRMNIPLELLHHEWIEKESHQPAEEQVDPKVSIYEFVKGKLDHWTGDQRDRGHGPPDCQKTDTAYNIIAWSAELWFFQQLEGADDIDINAWISGEGTEKLFRQYFCPIDDNAPRFPIITEANAYTLLRQLIKAGKVKDNLKDLLKQWKNILNLTVGTSMSKKMASIYNTHSEKFYIVPSPTSVWKMYGMHFSLADFFKEDAKGNKIFDTEAIEHATNEATQMRNAMRLCKFEVIEPSVKVFNPKSGTFRNLQPWLLKKLHQIKGECSALFISFSLHGYQGGIEDVCAIEGILRQINDDFELKELKQIPKIVVIQTCQDVLQPGWKNQIDGTSESLRKFVEEEASNLLLLLPVESKSYLNCFAEAMELVPKLERRTDHTIQDWAPVDARRAENTPMGSKDARELSFNHPHTATPAREGDDESDEDADRLL